MAHFAQLDDNNVVLQVIVVNDSDTTDVDGVEQENLGIQFCRRLFGSGTRWMKTSYNAKIRKNYAGIGFRYDGANDAFIPPQPYPSWALDKTSFQWAPPTPSPGVGYMWNEAKASWVTK